MKSDNFIFHLLIVTVLLSLPGVLFSQEKTWKSGYQPLDGQEGKDVRWFPTPQELVDKMLDMAKVSPADFLIDLGSGDGRMVITAARRGVRGIGIEYNADLVELSRKNALKAGVQDKVEFIQADLFEYDFTKGTVITMFLLPEINLRLRPKLLEMKSGTRILSTTFTMQTWQHDDIIKIDNKTNKWHTAYLWVVPAKVQGKWEFKEGELTLVQKFQMVSGKLRNRGKTVEISGGRLRGNDITFSAEGAIYTCRIDKNTMKGTVKKGDKTTDWLAERRQ